MVFFLNWLLNSRCGCSPKARPKWYNIPTAVLELVRAGGELMMPCMRKRLTMDLVPVPVLPSVKRQLLDVTNNKTKETIRNNKQVILQPSVDKTQKHYWPGHRCPCVGHSQKPQSVFWVQPRRSVKCLDLKWSWHSRWFWGSELESTNRLRMGLCLVQSSRMLGHIPKIKFWDGSSDSDSEIRR